MQSSTLAFNMFKVLTLNCEPELCATELSCLAALAIGIFETPHIRL